MSNEDNRRPCEQRPFKDMKGLLKFCLEATRSEDAPSGTNFEPMSEERRRWLEEAMSEMTTNPVERMSFCLKMIEEAEVDTETGTEQQIRALSELQDWGEDMDIAGDLIKINGLRVVPKLLSSEVSEIRWRCLELMGNLSQNNPLAQTALITLKLLPPMLLLLETDPNPTVMVKALYAISCLVRNNAEALQHFIAHDGLSVLVKSLRSNDDRLRVKTTFMMSSICNSNPALKDNLVAKGVIEQLVQILKDEDHDATHEHIMDALVSIISGHAAAREKCLSAELDVRSFLCQRIKFLEGKEPFQEEKEHAEKLLNLLNTNMDEQPSSHVTNTNLSLIAL
uniref:Nucleotide exchange factor Fes1 domain-containing protein n=1 Tax=Arion vulgaris TaxID=1028688 RepID=A0A0B6XZB5_9EUPU